ncbi:hypothetical protein PSP6_60003 [Paraburkholderia tropica]|nr:hypothetical protein PSP6_60003 [Paraburkholderia tropica]
MTWQSSSLIIQYRSVLSRLDDPPLIDGFRRANVRGAGSFFLAPRRAEREAWRIGRTDTST